MTDNGSLYKRITLPNGVSLLLIPMKGVDSIATSVSVAVGSRFETAKVSGISHFLEHMAFKGTRKYPTTEDVNEIERIGGIQNAYTDVDITKYHNKVFAADWRHALDINRELALFPRLEQKYFVKEKDVIIEEMKRLEDNPEVLVEVVFHEMLYPGTSLGMRVIGHEKSVRSVSAKTLRRFHNEWYVPDRTVVVVAGKISPKDASIMEKQVRQWFGEGKKKQKRGFTRVHPMQKTPAVKIVSKKDTRQAHLMLGVRAFARGSSDRFAWAVFNLLMGIGFTSRLFREIREKRGLCYHISSQTDSYDDVGSWHIYAGVATHKVEEALLAIVTELAKVVSKGVSDEEVRIAKRRMQTLVAFQMENPEFVNEFYARQEVYKMPILTVRDYLDKISRVTKEEIYQKVKKYIKQSTLNLTLVWKNKGGEEKLQKLLSF